MKLSKDVTVAVGLVAIAVIAMAGVLLLGRGDDAPVAANDRSAVGTDDLSRLTTAVDRSVELVVFLDVECEACRAIYPYIEQLRADYDGRINLGIRYFPIPSHTNSELAARVVESAARQDRLEQMYKRMYDTQAQWGESSRSQEELFRTFAVDLGLNMERFERDLVDPAVAERVRRDFDAGLALGVQGTPTLFLNGEMLSIGTYDELLARIDDALAA